MQIARKLNEGRRLRRRKHHLAVEGTVKEVLEEAAVQLGVNSKGKTLAPRWRTSAGSRSALRRP